MPLGDATAHGSVTVEAEADAYTVILRVEGLEPTARHWINTHGGSCESPVIDPSDMISLGDLEADASGTATFTSTTFPYPWALPAGGRILTVHNLPSDQRDGQEHIACADMGP